MRRVLVGLVGAGLVGALVYVGAILLALMHGDRFMPPTCGESA